MPQGVPGQGALGALHGGGSRGQRLRLFEPRAFFQEQPGEVVQGVAVIGGDCEGLPVGGFRPLALSQARLAIGEVDPGPRRLRMSLEDRTVGLGGVGDPTRGFELDAPPEVRRLVPPPPNREQRVTRGPPRALDPFELRPARGKEFSGGPKKISNQHP